jgi:protein-tyrosine-phosphatase
MKKQTVLFVCVHNAGRSQMAEAFTNKLAADRGLNVVGFSAGTMGGKTLNPLAVEVMAEEGISMVGQAPKLITDDLVKEADRVISMGCGVDADACPSRFIFSEDWKLDDPAGQPIETVRVIRNAIKVKVSALLEELAKT